MSTGRSYTIVTKKQTFGRVVFPIAYKLALYVRQSRGEAVENNPESFIMQTQGLLKIAREELEWPTENILDPFIENQKKQDGSWKHASGTKRLDDRPALQELVGYIERGEVKAVLVWLVDRLFRDEDGVDPRVFVQICRDHNCLILTSEGDVFDFSKESDRKRFTQEADAAGDFITKYLKGRAHPARKQVALRGEYDGRVVPVGFYVEQKVARKRFEKGTPRHYLMYEEHAKVVRWIFRRYRELAGDFAALKREIGAMPYVFPFFPTGMHVPHIHLKHNEYGYVISDRGLKDMLCNIAYIGWYYNKGVAPIKNNHPALVDEGDFWYAFDRLSPVTIDGELAKKERARFTKVGTIAVPALLDGILKGDDGLSVYVNQNAGGNRGAAYTIINNKEYYGGDKLGSIAVADLDTIFTSRLLAKLQAGKALRDFSLQTGEPQEWMPSGLEFSLVVHLTDVAKMQQESTAGIDAQIAQYTEEAASLDRTLHYGAAKLSPKKIEEYAERLARLQVSIDQLETKKSRAAERMAELAEFIEELDDIPDIWNGMKLEKQRRFVKLATRKITLTRVAPNWLQLAIAWWEAEEDYQDICYIWQRKIGEAWTDAESDVVSCLYPCADRATILQKLPHRSWTAIQHQAFRLRVYRPRDVRASNSSSLHKYLSLEDQAFMESVGIAFDPEEARKHAWWFSIQISEDSL